MQSNRNLLLFLIILLAGTPIIYAQGDLCENIQPFCAGSTEFIFPNSNRANGDRATAESGPNYNCLESQPYPSWFFLKIGNAGTLDFEVSQTVNPDGSGGTLDVDFISWGPFGEDESFCGSSSLNTSNMVACSYSRLASEVFSINNARVGEIYVVLITNYSEAAGYVRLQQTNTGEAGAGATDCSIVNILGDDQKICGNEPVELVANNVIATKYEWFKYSDTTNSYVLIPNQIEDRYTVTETGLYKIITTNEVTGTKMEDEVLIEFFEKPVATKPDNLKACSREASAIFDLTTTIAELSQNYMGLGIDFTANFYESLSDLDNGNSIASPENYNGVNNQEIISALIIEGSDCTSEPVSFNLEIFGSEELDLSPETIICIDQTGNLVSSISLGEDLGSDYKYEWTPKNDPDGDGVENAIFNITEVPVERMVSVIVTNTALGCSRNYSTEIKVFSPPIEVEIDISGSDFEDGYVVTANAGSALGDETSYEYRLDNGLWQNSPKFINVAAGLHLISARDIYGCGVAVSEAFRLVGYPRFFTPNGDGYNDTWNLVTDEFGVFSKLRVFDRYGKLIKELDPNFGGWDGTFINTVMPADDYWFIVDYREAGAGNVKQFKGHFSLKR
jgi:gliding motility-associated-like protein